MKRERTFKVEAVDDSGQVVHVCYEDAFTAAQAKQWAAKRPEMAGYTLRAEYSAAAHRLLHGNPRIRKP